MRVLLGTCELPLDRLVDLRECRKDLTIKDDSSWQSNNGRLEVGYSPTSTFGHDLLSDREDMKGRGLAFTVAIYSASYLPHDSCQNVQVEYCINVVGYASTYSTQSVSDGTEPYFGYSKIRQIDRVTSSVMEQLQSEVISFHVYADKSRDDRKQQNQKQSKKDEDCITF
ncbi:hypothetical protein FGO68_gene3453 [Halteria grandinella]|uniref:Uncharacterized protein n=1 Tax=Halteria grandinella TaxID=5974 RepID=A0A8J8SZ38_HALGN|nr:hypothetical protein FGO68_gene3453 [Halteria grandinella]